MLYTISDGHIKLELYNQVRGIPLVLKYLLLGGFLLGIDAALFEFQASQSISGQAQEHTELISLALSGLLVLLYYDQHKTQRQQADLMSRQTDLEERKTEWREEQRAARVEVSNWEFVDSFSDIDIAVSDSNQSMKIGPRVERDGDSIFAARVSNTGETVARDLQLRIEPLVNSPDLPRGYNDISLFLHITAELFELTEDIPDQYFNRKDVQIPSHTSSGLYASIRVEKLFSNDNEESITLAESIATLPFDVEDIVLRAKLLYEDVGGTTHEAPIAAVRLKADDNTTLLDAFAESHRVGYHGIPVNDHKDTGEFLIDTYMTAEYEGPSAVKYTFSSDE
ncbi:hypothetical protein [Haloarcula sp. Atlit-120R]|uniref:hypothetical protein n=1 Tax=Haloarcula sp. Atlit-120R TaxID=2282135 RepID=UPI000EF1C909|nr:hypothetical protein [Haloarcula sp. Atlit-120R]RLM33147.1 hypothetical protein DVK01_18305 [Haloarcula sp. Atlit-120R]